MSKIISALYNPETDCVEVTLDNQFHVTFNCQNCNARVVTISRAQAHVLRYSLHPYGKAPAICRSVYYLHLSNFSDILSHQWSSRSNISLALISSERLSLQAVSVQEDCYNSGQLSPEGLFSSSSHPQTLLGCCWLSMHQCRCLLLS